MLRTIFTVYSVIVNFSVLFCFVLFFLCHVMPCHVISFDIIYLFVDYNDSYLLVTSSNRTKYLENCCEHNTVSQLVSILPFCFSASEGLQ